MQAIDAANYVALHINTNGSHKYVRKGDDGLYHISDKRDRNSLLTLISELSIADYKTSLCVQAIYSYIATNYKKSPIKNILLDKFNNKPCPIGEKTHDVALLLFINNFHVYLNRRPRAIAGVDLRTLNVISEVYWRYSKGSEAIYNQWMTEFFVGTHKVIRDDNREIMSRLERISRTSSHYDITEEQSHIMGSLLPETLFHEGEFAYDPKTKNVVQGKYWNQLTIEEKKGKEKINAFWIQTENTPDGPSWFDLVYHRTWDFVRYLFLRHVMNSDRPQIGPYYKANGERGLHDMKAVFIEPQTEANRAYYRDLLIS